MDVSIIIVNYNTKELTLNCLESIYKQTKDISYEIILSDNDSHDGSIEAVRKEYPEVIILENKKNLGFGAANNKALKIAKGKYVLYLNSDTVIVNNAIKLFYDYFEEHKDENIGALGCNLLGDKFQFVNPGSNFPTVDSIFQNTIGDFKQVLKRTVFFFLPNNFSFTKGRNEKLSYSEYLGEIGYITGADLFMLNNENALFDEDFFLYFEDTDINKRLEEKGLKRLIIQGPQIQHLENKSNKFKSKIDYYGSISKMNFNYSSMLYLKKHGQYNNFKFKLIKFLNFLIWVNPFIVKKTKVFLKRLREI